MLALQPDKGWAVSGPANQINQAGCNTEALAIFYCAAHSAWSAFVHFIVLFFSSYISTFALSEASIRLVLSVF